MKKLLQLKTMLLLCALIVGSGSVWADPVDLFHESFGDNSGSARAWNDSYSVKSGVSAVYSGITGYTVSNVKQGKNTTGSDKSGLNQSSQGVDAYIIIGPLNVAGYNTLTLTYQWKAASIKATYTTKAYYATSSGGEYTEVSGTGDGATSFVERSYSLPAAAQVSTLYLKIVWNTSNSQAIIDEVNLSGVEARPDAPTFNVAGGEFNEAFDLTISSATGTTLKYTTDGTDPATSGTATAVDNNSAVVAIPAATTRVRAIAIKSGVNSNETDVTYTYTSLETPTFSISPSSLDLKVGANGTITLTTNSDGDVSFSCDDDHVTLTGTGNSRTVSANAEGVYTVNVSVAASATYMAKNGSVTLNVTKYDTTVGIDASGITNNDLKNGTAAGTLTASVTYGEPATNVPESSVTWSSSNTDVATVNETGVVTLVGTGNTTITATYAGNDTYSGSNNTFALTVYDTRTFFTWDLSKETYSSASTEQVTWPDDRATMIVDKDDAGTAANNYLGGDANNRTSSRFYTNSILTITPSSGYRISSVVFTATSDGYAGALKNSTWTNATATASTTTVTVTPTDGKEQISAVISGTCGFTLVKVNYDIIATISNYGTTEGWSTYSCDYVLDFSGVTPAGLTAYIITGHTGNAVTMTEVTGKVPANTGLLLKGTKNATYAIPAAATPDVDVSSNLLRPGTGAAVSAEDGKTKYVLGVNGELAEFQKLIDGGSSATVAKGKAYLQFDEEIDARALTFDFDEQTGISEAKRETINNNRFYNLNGQQVAQPTKGLYIVNGRKYIVK